MSISPEFLKYNALDSACTLEVHNQFWPDLSQGFEPAYDLTVGLFPVLMFMQHRGIKVSLDELAAAKREILATKSEKQAELNKLCGRDLNVNSSKECQAYFYVEKGIPPYYNDGAVTVDDLALQRIARGTARRAGLREAKLVQEIRGLQKLDSTYLSMEFDSDGRFRSSYNPRGTRYGRLSSSKTIFGTGGNAQNLDPAFKRFLVADPGYILWEVDKRQAEWVVVAYLTGDANMISVIESGKDTHIRTASLMFDVEPEVIEYENKLVGGNTDPAQISAIRASDDIIARYAHILPRTMSARQCAKKAGHSLNYDEGYKKFALLNEMEESDARKIVELYHSIYPGIRIWYEAVKRQLQKDRSLTNCFGRRVRFMDAWSPDLWKAAYSMLPQSTVVDSLNIGLVKTYADEWLCGRDQCNIDILAQVHDSILMQVPIEVATDSIFQGVIDRVYDYVSPEITYHSRSFKIKTDSKMGLNWGSHHKERNPAGMREIKDLNQIRAMI